MPSCSVRHKDLRRLRFPADRKPHPVVPGTLQALRFWLRNTKCLKRRNVDPDSEIPDDVSYFPKTASPEAYMSDCCRFNPPHQRFVTVAIAEIWNLLAQPLYALAIAVTLIGSGLQLGRVGSGSAASVRFALKALVFAGFSYSLIAAGIMPAEPTTISHGDLFDLWVGGLKTVWWFLAAWLVAAASRAVLIFKRLPRQTQFAQDIAAGAIYIGAILGVTADVFDIPVTGLLAASGVIAIVLGLALQSTLGDVFSGIVLDLAKPYRPADWVIFSGGIQGRVIETNWRATHIRTPENDVAVIPNSTVVKTSLVIVGAADTAHGFTIKIRLEPTVPPLRGAVAIQSALLSCAKILRSPPPVVSVQSLDALAIEYDVQFFTLKFEEGPAAQDELFDMAFRHCLSSGLRFAPPKDSPASAQPQTTAGSKIDARRLLLDRLHIFSPLSESERIALVPKMHRKTHKAGAILVQQGSVANALSIVGMGALIAVQKHAGAEIEALRLAPGDSFGEAGVLAGAATMFEIRALTKVVTYEIAKDDLAPILKQRPAIVDALGDVLANRQALGRSTLEDITSHANHGETLAATFRRRVKTLFGMA